MGLHRYKKSYFHCISQRLFQFWGKIVPRLLLLGYKKNRGVHNARSRHKSTVLQSLSTLQSSTIHIYTLTVCTMLHICRLTSITCMATVIHKTSNVSTKQQSYTNSYTVIHTTTVIHVSTAINMCKVLG